MSVNNNYLEMQIVNQVQIAKSFKNNCAVATKKDDGRTSKGEEKLLKKINKATDDYIIALNKLLK
ncbi:MAG: hypothetical protein K5870_01580 [Lachnospiraceae bacterium]|nr:hypothetical protein [Lachnospiraceae bacterium]